MMLLCCVVRVGTSVIGNGVHGEVVVGVGGVSIAVRCVVADVASDDVGVYMVGSCGVCVRRVMLLLMLLCVYVVFVWVMSVSL